jgi:hypothetical protein
MRRVKDVVWSVQQLELDMNRLQKALATAVMLGSPAHVIEGLKREYKEAFNNYNDFMDLRVIDLANSEG